MRGWRLLHTVSWRPQTSLTQRRLYSTAMATDNQNNSQRPPKRPFSNNSNKWKSKKTKREKNITEGSSEDVLRLDIEALLASRRKSGDIAATEGEAAPLPEQWSETEVEILDVSSTGDGLGMKDGSDQVYIVPFTVPGDVVNVKVVKHLTHQTQTLSDFVSVVKPSPLRDDSRVKCKYFSKCGGCQFQMLDYHEQLKLKGKVLQKAYANFANLAPEQVPRIQDTIGSPLEYGYRTKLTPHFDGPPGFRHGRGQQNKARFEKCPDIGFMRKGQRKVLDIEDCPIGTDAVRLGMQSERERMKQDFPTYQRGATLLLRETTKRFNKDDPEAPSDESKPESSVRSETGQHIDIKTCETDSKAITTEYVDSYTFTNPAGSFFQNNNSILPKFTSYIREHILPRQDDNGAKPTIKYLIDAYSGSGLFTITLSSTFTHSTGIDIASASIQSARDNARLNGLSPDRCEFIAADANELFGSVSYPPDETVVVLDPPRKGCDEGFLKQLRRFGPRRVVYVSCNVHTQARDVGGLVRGDWGGQEGPRYEIESLVGFDFFPQTGHVEGVAILNRVDQMEGTVAAQADE